MRDKQSKHDKLRKAAEMRLADAPPTEEQVRPPEELLHELQVYQVELEMQNDELRRAQAIIEESRDRYVDLYDFAPVGYMTLDRNGAIAEINITGAALLGVERSKLLHRRFASFVATEERDNWHRGFLSALKDERGRRVELQLQRNDGSLFSGQMDFLRRKEGEHLSTRVVLTDVTERSRLEAKLRESEEMLHAIFDGTLDGVCLVKARTGRHVANNPAFSSMIGYSHEELAQFGLADLHRKRDLSYATEQLERVLRGEIQTAKDVPIKRKDGSVFYADIRTTRLSFGGEDYLLGNFRDITERKRMENELMERRDEMRELQKLQVAAQTVAAVAHELNQPLTAIASYCAATLMLLHGKTPDVEEARNVIERGKQQAYRAGRSIHEMFDFLNAKELPFEDFDLNREINLIIDDVRKAHELDCFHVELRMEENLPPVRAKRTHVQKALLNLLNNGIEAMQHAGVPHPDFTVTVRTAKDKSLAQVTVQDNGPGFRIEDAQRLFEPFFTTKTYGIGMGLSISRSLIEANGGLLWVDQGQGTQEGTGAVFHLTLPFAA